MSPLVKRILLALVILIFGSGLQFLLLYFFGYDPGIELGIVFIVIFNAGFAIMMSIIFLTQSAKRPVNKVFKRVMIIVLVANLIMIWGVQRNH